MKILPFDPKSTSSDHSRLGFHVDRLVPSELSTRKHGIVILGIADETGIKNVGGRLGAKDGPAAARARLYKFTTATPLAPLYDLGDLLPAGSIEQTHAEATALVRTITEAGHYPIVLGGGHDLGFPHALGVLEAQKAKFRFCNIDAHLDVRSVDPLITSGSPWFLLNEHALFRQTKSRIEEFGIQPHCNARSLIDYAEKHKFGMHWLADIRNRKTSADFQFAKLLGPKTGKERLLVSLDIDSVQFADAPGCSAPQTEGFSASEVIRMSFLAGNHPRVSSFGIFELSPSLDPDGRTALLMAHCINACLNGASQRLKSSIQKNKRNGSRAR